MTRTIIMNGIVQTTPIEEEKDCGFFFGNGSNNLPVKVYSPSLVRSVMSYIRKGMTLRIAGKISDLFVIAEHIEIHRAESI